MTAKQLWSTLALGTLGSLIAVGAIVATAVRGPRPADPPTPSPAPLPVPTPDVPVTIATQRAKLKLSDGRTATFLFTQSSGVLTCAAAIGLDEVLGYALAPVSDPPPPAPGPTPEPGPAPSPQPIAVSSNLRVLFTYDPLQLAAMPVGQQAILASPAVRGYLDKHCPMESGCLSGTCPRAREGGAKTPSYRFLSKDADVSKLAPAWQQTMKAVAARPTPWMIAVDEAGQTVIDQAWPANVGECLELLRRHAGP